MAVPSDLRHFTAAEFLKDPARANPVMCHAIDAVRDRAGVPVHIHVCYAPDGHATHSYHLTGQAVDFHFSPGLTLARELSILLDMPVLGGIGYYPSWSPRPGWHVDIRKYGPKSPRLFWIGHGGRYEYFTDPVAFKKAIGA